MITSSYKSININEDENNIGKKTNLTPFQQRRLVAYQNKTAAYKMWVCRMRKRGIHVGDGFLYVLQGYDIA